MAEPVSGATLLGVAAVLVVFGYFIRFQRRLYLVVGYGPEDAAERATLANLVGGLLIFVGMLTIALGVISTLGGTSAEIWGAYTLVVLVSTAVVAIAGWERRDPDPASGRGE